MLSSLSLPLGAWKQDRPQDLPVLSLLEQIALLFRLANQVGVCRRPAAATALILKLWPSARTLPHCLPEARAYSFLLLISADRYLPCW
jgi:hypothetical protein